MNPKDPAADARIAASRELVRRLYGDQVTPEVESALEPNSATRRIARMLGVDSHLPPPSRAAATEHRKEDDPFELHPFLIHRPKRT
ncbi:MAG TPA: hypothetical protein VHC70_03970 [Phycisphaerales bacterium]|jgi:hypothetical protein|nr:hypothetical protein [Phycisphaerales bacterium]